MSSVRSLIELVKVDKVVTASDGTDLRLLNGVSLKIHAGEFVAITGASGSGKSTLMNILGCLDHATHGQYLLNGEPVADLTTDELAHLRRNIFGFVFQHYHLLPRATAVENVALPAFYAGFSRAEREERAISCLAQLGLTHKSANFPYQLSGGQQQRVSIARALMNGGSIILADEPTGALDSHAGEEVMMLLSHLVEVGHTVILITHDRQLALRASRIIEIKDGCIVSDESHYAGPQILYPSEPPRRSPRHGLPFDALFMAITALRSNIVRTVLTLLGLIIGVAAIMALSGIGLGAQEAVLKQLSVFGVNRLYVTPGGTNPREPGGRLTMADVDLVSRAPGVLAAMPYVTGKVSVRAGHTDIRANGAAVTVRFPQILNWGIAHGSFFTEEDEHRMATVAVIGAKVRAELFQSDIDPVGRFILINNVPFQVIGVLVEKGALSGDTDDDDIIAFPYSTGGQRVYGTQNLSWISVLLTDLKIADATTTAISMALEAKHRSKDFEVYNRAAAIAAQRHTQRTMTLLLGMTATISLVVGGIGIMNIMLMTVAERTREIGIRLAIGARPKDILRQFLSEAIILSAIGGTIGLGSGLAIGFFAVRLGMPVVFTAHDAIIALGSALMAGVIFGYIPARRASMMTPVAALSRD